MTKDGWILYPSALLKAGVSPSTLSGGITRVFSGKRVNGACVEEGTGQGRAAGAPIYIQESGFNPKTCAYMETTTVLSNANQTKLDAASSSSASLAPLSTGVYYLGHVKTSYIDPVSIEIAHQVANIEFRNSAITSARANRHGFTFILPAPFPVYDRTYLERGTTSLSRNKYTATADMRNGSFLYWVLQIFGAGGWAACHFPTSARADFYFTDVAWPKSGNSSYFNYSYSDHTSGACTNLVSHGTNIGGGWIS